MRDGEIVGERTPAVTSHDEIIRLMVGRPLQALFEKPERSGAVSYTHLRAHETVLDIVCRLLLEKKT